MTLVFITLLALSWTGLSLAILAMLFRRMMPPRQAAWRAFGIGLVVNTIGAGTAAPGEPLPAILLILACHLLLLAPLLLAARREAARGGPSN
ncbi:hypothetical protein GCM10011504_14330 [Siccirubricoccus deserti]|uniref:Uncharacterized protein n=1 Tax=Siccirubricoccus deserti TaxID=2013562 RepID=A0A9X0QW01_9PROT|nr:hypothetical protein [Siccirubricoccus deserti]MBC4014915.1 hypothetical protein [Siccirubricoccus deserti]GGC37126.1 hypothetical protein GCM10011504_14330 [Siccirubricoccus deserti]